MPTPRKETPSWYEQEIAADRQRARDILLKEYALGFLQGEGRVLDCVRVIDCFGHLGLVNHRKKRILPHAKRIILGLQLLDPLSMGF